MFYFLSVLCTLCRNVMFCKFQESSRHSFETVRRNCNVGLAVLLLLA